MTKEEVIKQVVDFVSAAEKDEPTKEIDVSRISIHFGWQGEERKEIFKLFDVNSMTKFVDALPGLETYKSAVNPNAVCVRTKKTGLMAAAKASEQAAVTEKESEIKTEKPAKIENIQNRVDLILKAMNKGLVEKEEACRLALLSSVAGETIFFLGPPGTAKSLVCRRLKCAFKGEDNKELKNFEYLMNEFSTPDEVYGPVSLKALEENKYERITEGYLPDAEVAFLDEIWKAGPAIQNTLLTILNEKKFHNGNQVVEVPLRALVSASNELPAENRGLEALWDRFLIRLIVNPIKSEKDFLALVCGGEVSSEADVSKIKNQLISVDELKDWKDKINAVEVPELVCDVVTAVRKEMTLRTGYYVSDRRWKKIVHLMKASAFLNGRSEVDLMDCQLIEYCIWNTEDQIADAKEIVRKCIEEHGLECSVAADDIYEEMDGFKNHVQSQFYVKKVANEPEIEVMNDGKKAYTLKNAKNYAITYNTWDNRTVTVKYVSENSYYDANKKGYGSYYSNYISNLKYNAEVKKISWDVQLDHQTRSNEAEVKLKKITGDEYEKDPHVFDPNYSDLLKVRQTEADKNYYKPLKERISEEKENLKIFRKEKGEAFESNLFADQEICRLIFKQIDKTDVELDKLLADLNEMRERYQK